MIARGTHSPVLRFSAAFRFRMVYPLVALFFGYRGRWLRKKVAKAAPPQAIAAAQGKNKMMIRSLTQQFLSTESGAAAAAGNAAAGKAVSKIIFDQYDRDGSGFIESDELKQLCDAMGKGLTAEQLTRVFAALDKNVDEKISYDEFSVWWELGLDIDALHDPEAARKKIAEEKELARQEAERESAGESRSAHDLADDGIRVNAIAPGVIETPMTVVTRANPESIGRFMAHTPMKRPGKPEELVGPVLFLASDASSYVTGALLPVDGGYLAA